MPYYLITKAAVVCIGLPVFDFFFKHEHNCRRLILSLLNFSECKHVCPCVIFFESSPTVLSVYQLNHVFEHTIEYQLPTSVHPDDESIQV